MKEAASAETTVAKTVAPVKKFNKPKPKLQNVKQAAATPAKAKVSSRPKAKPHAKPTATVGKATKREDYLGSLVDAALERKKPQEVNVHVEVTAVPPALMRADHVVAIPATDSVSDRRASPRLRPADQPAARQNLVYNRTETHTSGYATPSSHEENKSHSATFHGRQMVNPVIKIK